MLRKWVRLYGPGPGTDEANFGHAAVRNEIYKIGAAIAYPDMAAIRAITARFAEVDAAAALVANASPSTPRLIFRSNNVLPFPRRQS